MIPDGLTTLESKHGPKETMDRLAAAVTARGMAVLARIDHAEAAAKAGLELRPTEGADLRQSKSRNPADASGADDRHRPAAQSAGLAG